MNISQVILRYPSCDNSSKNYYYYCIRYLKIFCKEKTELIRVIHIKFLTDIISKIVRIELVKYMCALCSNEYILEAVLIRITIP